MWDRVKRFLGGVAQSTPPGQVYRSFRDPRVHQAARTVQQRVVRPAINYLGQPTPKRFNPRPSFGRASDRYNPFDRDYVRPDGQVNFRTSMSQARQGLGQDYRTYIKPTTDKVPGFIRDSQPDRGIQFKAQDVLFPAAGVLRESFGRSKSGRDMARGAGEFAASAPQWLGGLTKSQIETGKLTSVNPLKMVVPSFPEYLANRIAPRISLVQNEDAKKRAMAGWVSDKQEQNRKWIESSDLSKQESENDLARSIGSGGASLATAAGLTALTKSTAAPAAVFGAIQKGNTYEEARAAGMSPEDADILSTAAGTTEAVLEKIGLDVFFNKFGTGSGVSNFVANSLIKMGSEALQEGSQELSGNFWAKVGYDKERDLMEGVFESAFIGGILGGVGGGSASSMQQNLYQKARQSGLDHESASTFADVMADKLSNKIDQAGKYIKENPPGLTTKNTPKKPGKVDVPLGKDEVILYHRTSPENAAKIRETGKMFSKENTGEIFLSNKKAGQNVGYGEEVVPVRVKRSDIRLDDEFPSGEKHFAIKSDKAIPTLSQPTVDMNIEAPQINLQKEARIASETGKTGKMRTLGRLQTEQNIPQDLRGMFQDREYTVRDTNELWSRARQEANTDAESSFEYVMNNANDESLAKGYALIEKYMNEGNKERAGLIATQLAENNLAAGRHVQANTLFKRMTPAGMQEYAVRKIKKALESSKNQDKTRKKMIKAGILDQNGKVKSEILSDIYETADKVFKMEDGLEKELARFEMLKGINELQPSSTTDKAVYLWKAGLLSGTVTHLVNVVSTTGNNITEQTAKAIAVPVDTIISMFTGKRSVGFTLRGRKQGFNEGLANAKMYVKTGFDAERISTKWDLQDVTFDTKLGKTVKKPAEFIYRTLGAEDKMFWYSSYRNTLYEQAILQAKSEGLKGEARENRITELVAKPNAKMDTLATETADVEAYHNKTILGKAAKAIAGVPGGRFIVPFTNTPAAVATQVINYSPVGVLYNLLEKKITNGKITQRDVSMSVARSTLGTAVGILLGASLYDDDKVALDAPQSATERAQWELEGKQPNSIKIGNKWRRVEVLGPLGFAIMWGGYFKRGQEEGGANAVMEATTGMLKSVTDQSFLRGVSGVMSAISDPQRGADIFFSNTAGSVIPSIVNQSSNAMDPYKRESRGPLETIQSRTPLRFALPQKTDVLGSPIENSRSPLEWFTDPTRPQKERNVDPVVSELSRLQKEGFNVTPAKQLRKQKVGDHDIKLNSEQLSEFQSNLGNAYRNAWQEVISAPTYQQLTDDQKKNVLEDVKRNVTSVEKLRIIEQYGLLGEQELANEIIKLNKYQRIYATTGNIKVEAPEIRTQTDAPLSVLGALSGEGGDVFWGDASDSKRAQVMRMLSQMPQNETTQQAVLYAVLGKTKARKLLGHTKAKGRKGRKVKGPKMPSAKPRGTKIGKVKMAPVTKINFNQPKLSKAKQKKIKLVA
jgi:hypothetical protein